MPSTKQPPSLYLIFFTELWERIGFYTVQTIIVLYMVNALGYGDTKSYLIYAVFSGLVYLLPVLGGHIADRYLGYKKAVSFGGLTLIVSYLILALPGNDYFFLGISILICGHGLFKPNITSLVGTLYEKNDPRREGGFTIFYMGINIGALIPPLITGAIIRHYGWHPSFMLAAAALIISMVIFFGGRRALKKYGLPPLKSPLHKGIMPTFKTYLCLTIGFVIIVAVLQYAFHYPSVAQKLLETLGLVVLIALIVSVVREPKVTRNRLYGAIILIVISIGFWALFNQTFTSLILFAERNMSKSFLGLTIDAQNTQFFNPFFIVILSPLFSQLWTKLARRNKNLSYPAKFTGGIVCICIGFLILPLFINLFSHQGMTPAWCLVVSYFIQTVGELLLSPIALAMITDICPVHLTGMMMGVWFFSNSVAALFSGTLATFTSIPHGTSVVEASSIYQHGFFIFGLCALALTIVSLLLVPTVKRLIAD